MIYELTEAIENYKHCKVNFVIDNEHVNADLGNYEINSEEKEEFVAKYTSAVVHKTNIIDYKEDE